MSVVDKAAEIADEFAAGCTTEELLKCFNEFKRLMKVGLQEDGHDMPCIPSYVTDVPSGKETGTFLAMDLGGTNIRACSVELKGDGTFDMIQSKTVVPPELQTAKSSTELFGFIADHLQHFLTKYHPEHCERDHKDLSKAYRLGFTFSFPVIQTSINSGKLLRWTKGFQIEETINQDVIEILQAEIDKRKLPVHVAAIVNDTVGTLMARSYASPSEEGSLIGAIFGTGTNGAYVERIENIPKLRHVKGLKSMVINMEWAAFDNKLNVMQNTAYDKMVDDNSINPGFQMFEKRVSGMFLGEILRQTLQSLIRESQLFVGHSSQALDTQYGIDTASMSTIAADSSPNLAHVHDVVVQQFGIASPSLQDCRAVKAVSDAIARRSARLAACAVTAVCDFSGRFGRASEARPVDVGADGSLVEFYPDYVPMCLGACDEILGSGASKKIRIGLAKDGSGVGAALCALQAKKQEEDGVTF